MKAMLCLDVHYEAVNLFNRSVGVDSIFHSCQDTRRFHWRTDASG